MEKSDDNHIIISFIITDYNIPIPLLRECIESILSLDLKFDSREIILVDDGSLVSPLGEIGDLASRITYIRQENQGLSVARNVGIEASRGTFIQFVDGDDCLLHSYGDCAAEAVGKGADMLFFGQTHRKSVLCQGKTRLVGNGAEYMLHNNLHASACGYIFRKELLSDGLRFTKGVLHEDEEFTPMLTLRAGKVAVYDGAAYFYREREGSIVHSEETEHIRRRLNDFTGIVCRLRDEAERQKGDKAKALSRRVRQLSMDYLCNVMNITHDAVRLDDAITLLKEHRLYPIPIKNYTMKYLAFSLLVRNSLGRRILAAYICR